jgi:hypothetical protein
MDQPFRSLYVRPDLAGNEWAHQRDGLRGVDDAGISWATVAVGVGFLMLLWSKMGGGAEPRKGKSRHRRRRYHRRSRRTGRYIRRK